jgi:hypothetical protein
LRQAVNFASAALFAPPPAGVPPSLVVVVPVAGVVDPLADVFVVDADPLLPPQAASTRAPVTSMSPSAGA